MAPVDATRLTTLLLEATNEAMNPEEAQALFARSKEAWPPNASLELLWERDPETGGYEYGVIAPLSDRDVLSMQLRRGRGVPWALRNASRWTDADVCSVNGKRWRIEDLMARVDILWAQSSVSKQLVRQALVVDEANRLNLRITESELQVVVDDYRARHGLVTAAQTERWLHHQGLTYARLEATLEGRELRRRVRDEVTEADLKGFASASLSEWDEVVAFRLRFAAEEIAQCSALRLSSLELGAFIVEALALQSDPTLVRITRTEARAWENEPSLFTLPPGATSNARGNGAH